MGVGSSLHCEWCFGICIWHDVKAKHVPGRKDIVMQHSAY
jgi:hypothetical protein